MEHIENIVEELNFADVEEIAELFADSFKKSHFVRIINSKKDPFLYGFFKASLNLFRNDKTARIFGIKSNGKVVCASLISDAGNYLGLIDTVRFIFSLLVWIGILPALRLLKFFFYAVGSTSHNKNFIDFILFGTLAGYQKSGLGTKMLKYIYGYAKNKKSEGLILTCIGDSPAYGLYIKEGFKVERKEQLYSTTLNFMRKRI